MARVDEGVRAFKAGAAIARNLRVKLSASVLAVAVLADDDIGTIRDASFASGDLRGVYLASKQGTMEMVANGAIAVGDQIWTAAAGKVTNAAGAATGSFYRGTALTAAANDGDFIEVMPSYAHTAHA